MLFAAQLWAPEAVGAVAPGPLLARAPYVTTTVWPSLRVSPETMIVLPETERVPVFATT